MAQELTLEQAIIITGFTGRAACAFSHFHADVEKRLGRPVWTHEFASEEFTDQVRAAYHDDFIALCNKEPA